VPGRVWARAGNGPRGHQTHGTRLNGFPSRLPDREGYADIAKGACAGRHTHPGLETSYVLEQELIVKIDGQPDHLYKAGEGFQIPPGVVHDACATANNPVRVLTVHIVEKGKPLGSPAP
jgi:quercetin dioxygenase-like cupin family protein